MDNPSYDPVPDPAAAERPEIPAYIVEQWTQIIGLISEICAVPASLVMKRHPTEIEVFVSAGTEDNPYKSGEKARLGTGLYCETVMAQRKELCVPNARKDPLWDRNPDIKVNMISYLGQPLLWPDKEVFGTLCILDSKENSYSDRIKSLLAKFRRSIETSLALLCEIQARKKAQSEVETTVTGLMVMKGVMVERELRMIELKEEMNKLLVELGRPKKFP